MNDVNNSYSFILTRGVEPQKVTKTGDNSTGCRAWSETGIQHICGTNITSQTCVAKGQEAALHLVNKAIFSAKFEIACIHVFYR